MGTPYFFSLNQERLKRYIHHWIVYGFFVYLASFYFFGRYWVYQFFLICIVLPVVLHFRFSRDECVQDKRAFYACTIFLGYLAISALWGEGSFFKAIRYVFYGLCLMLSIEVVMRNVSERCFMKSIVCIGFVAAIYYMTLILLQEHNTFLYETERFNFALINGWENDSVIDTAVIMGLPVIASCSLFCERKGCIRNFLLIATALMCFTLMLFTKSRMAILAVVITVLFISFHRRKKSNFIFVLILLLGMIFVFIFMLINGVESAFIERVKEGNYRLEIWHGALRQFMDHWLFGQGYGTDAKIKMSGGSNGGLAFHAHNTILDILRVGGIVGGLLFAYMVGVMFRFSYFHSENKFFLYWLLFGILCMTTNGILPLVKPVKMEYLVLWMPFFLLYFYNKNAALIPTQALCNRENEKQAKENI